MGGYGSSKNFHNETKVISLLLKITFLLFIYYICLKKVKMENLINRIKADPAVCNGKPVIRGLRITVSTVLDMLAAGESISNILDAFPVLEEKDILACLEYASKVADKTILSYVLKAG